MPAGIDSVALSIGETGFTETDFRRYAYAPKGVRVEAKVPGHRYRTTTLIAARLAGCFTAPLLFEGSCDTLAFNTYLSEMLCPLLDETHVVIMDNASFHKGSQTAALIRESGASLLFLPPYSPELNPIEKDFANIKRIRQCSFFTGFTIKFQCIKMHLVFLDDGSDFSV